MAVNINDIPDPPRKELLPIKSQLSKKQESFCRYYVSNGFNAVAAAREAGYHSPNNAVYDLMKSTKVCGRIQEMLDPALTAAGITRERLLHELKEQSTADVSEILDVDNDGNVSIKKDFGGKGKSVRRVTYKKDGIVSVEMTDNLKAKELLMKGLGIDQPKEVNVNIGPNVDAMQEWELAKQRASQGIIDTVVVDVVDVQEVSDEEEIQEDISDGSSEE